MSENGDLHKDHRKRMLKRYIENGINCFEKHEILEMLLFNVFSRCNTNDISHRLLNEFNSIKGVLSASAKDLETIDGIAENAAVRICFLGDFYRYIALEDSGPTVLDSTERIVEYCKENVNVNTTEFFLILFMDKKMTLITKYFEKGHFNYVDPRKREIAAKAITPGCEYAIAVHNHLDEFVRPSSADITATFNLNMFLQSLKVNLLDHLILNKDSHFSMRTSPSCQSIWLM